MKPINGQTETVYYPSTTRLRFAGGRSAHVSGQDQLRFSGQESNGKRPVGVLKALRTLLGQAMYSDNRQMAKGMLYHYGCSPWVLLPLLAMLGPVGCVFMIPALPVGMFLSWRGGRIIENLKQDPKIQQGPLHTIDDITKLWDRLDKTPNAPDAIVEKLKLLLDQLFPDNETGVAAARDSLKKQLDGKVFNLLNRLALVRHATANRLSGKLLRGIDKFANLIPIKPLRIPLRLTSYVVQGLMVLMHPHVLQKAAAAAARRI